MRGEVDYLYVCDAKLVVSESRWGMQHLKAHLKVRRGCGRSFPDMQIGRQLLVPTSLLITHYSRGSWARTQIPLYTRIAFGWRCLSCFCLAFVLCSSVYADEPPAELTPAVIGKQYAE